MQFKRKMADLVLLGKKTQTRRINPARYKVGSIQPVQCGYRDKAKGHIKILKIWKQRLGDVNEQEAKAEGFNSLTAFDFYIRQINKPGMLSYDTFLTVYEFVRWNKALNEEQKNESS